MALREAEKRFACAQGKAAKAAAKKHVHDGGNGAAWKRAA
jgi:hypothetical protein